MKRFVTPLIVVLGSLVAVVLLYNPAQTQDLQELSSAFESCVDSGVNSCASSNSISTGDITEYVVTTGNGRTGAENTCCSKSSVKKRRACLNRVRRKINRARSGFRQIGAQNFIIALRSELQDLRRSDCGNSYPGLF